MQILNDQIIFKSRFLKKVLRSFGAMVLMLFLSSIFFEDLKKANTAVVIVVNLVAGGSIVVFFIILFNGTRRLDFDATGMGVQTLFGYKKHPWTEIKTIRSYQNERKNVYLEFWFQDKSLKLTPENLGIQNNHSLFESKQTIRKLTQALTERGWVGNRVVNDQLDWLPTKEKRLPKPKFKIAEMIGSVEVTQMEATMNNGVEEINSVTRYTSPTTDLVIQEGYSVGGRKVTNYGVFFSEKINGSTYYYDFGVEKYDADRGEVIFYHVCDHKNKMRMVLKTHRLEKLRRPSRYK